MKIALLFFVLFLTASNASGQQFIDSAAPAEPAGKTNEAFLAIPKGITGELAATVRDLATVRDKPWEALTFAQIAAAAAADEQTSIFDLHHCPSCREIGISRFVVGIHPDAHKYIVAGVVEIAIEVVAAHYLHHRGPVQKWYWRSVWTLPQTLSLYGHTWSSFRNISSHTRCDPAGQYCY